jgi:L-lactate dehydrogenase complex protein LldE
VFDQLRVSLFVTCIVDQLYPEIGEATVRVLERQGVAVAFPAGQTCCGQPAFNAGFWDEARDVAGRNIEILRGQGTIVTPSGSCAAMIRHYYPELFKASPQLAAAAKELASRTYELSEYLVDVLGLVDLGARYAGRLTYHPSCHLLRGLHAGAQPQELLEHVAGAELTPLPGANECCGFGGLFSVKQPAISAAMLDKKLANVGATEAELLVTTDASCMMHMQGGLSRDGARCRACHIAQVLDGMV